MAEHRDDFETLPPPPSPSSARVGSSSCFPFDSILNVPRDDTERCRVSSLCHSLDSRDAAVGIPPVAAAPHLDTADNNNNSNEEEKPSNETETETNVHDDENLNLNLSPSNDTRMEQDEQRLDLNSVLSGNDDVVMTSIEEQDGMNGGNTNVSVKNLSRLFEENDGKPTSSTNNTTGANHRVRPPLAPARSKTEEGGGGLDNKSSHNDNGDDRRLSVFLRIRPPVSSTGKEGVDGAISTIEVLNNNHDDATATASLLPNTIRTYPPLASNAAKVVRTGNNKLTKRNTSKSFHEDVNRGHGKEDTAGEVLGVKEYAYSGVFGPTSTQCDVYESVASPLVEGLFPDDADGELGESALLFTLGVTNAGKTHTVMGTGFEKKKKSTDKVDYTTPHKEWGIIPRSLHHILYRVKNLNDATPVSSGGPTLQLFMSYLEIYNEAIYDLLPDKTKQPGSKRPFDGPPALKLRESRRGRIFVRGLARHPVDNVREGLDLAQEAKKNRHTSNNNINSASSRSHSICQFEIAYHRGPSDRNKRGVHSSDADSCSEYESDDDSSVSSAGSKKGRNSTILWIVDLAGSERSKRTGAISHTRHQKEAALINASLMNLMRCLREMLNHQPKKRGTNKGAGVVPFRESKLTHMFMNHLTGPSASRTSMIVNVNPAADDFDETQHVLSYAATARSVKISMVDYSKKHRILAKESNVKLSPVKKIKELAKKLSPQNKRKGTASDSKPVAKRLRTNNAVAPNKRAGGQVTAKNAPTRPASAKSQRGGNAEVEKLREENFSLGITIDDLEQQLANCEEEIRAEVVEMMNEQLQESKEWYEGRIDNLKQQLKNMRASNSKQASSDSDAKKREDDLVERINECEEEMARMRDEHKEELDEKSAELLNVTNIHVAEMEQAALVYQDELRAECEEKERLLAENGALRHKTKEIQVSHDAILAKYNELLSRMNSDSPDTFASINPEPTEVASQNPYHAKLPRERCSGVASTSAPLDIKNDTPKKKGNKWRIFSPKSAKKMSPNAAIVGQKSEKERSPLGDVNHSRVRPETTD